jgi:hypothetical protein
MAYDRYAGIKSLPGADGKMSRPFRVDENWNVIYLDEERGAAQPEGRQMPNEQSRVGIMSWDELDRKRDELETIGQLGKDNPIRLAEAPNPNWNGYDVLRAQGERDGQRLKNAYDRFKRSASIPTDSASIDRMTAATNDALNNIQGVGKSGATVGLSSEFSRVGRLPDFSRDNWKKVTSTHSASAYEHLLPGTSGRAVKVYLKDSEHGNLNTATITSPTDSIEHYTSWPIYQLGFPVNASSAEAYMTDHRNKKGNKNDDNR